MLFLKVCGLILFSLFALFFFLHIRTQKSPNQQRFLKGTIPSLLPDGVYRGSVNLKQNSWQGKKFDRSTSTGINLLRAGNTDREAFPFKTYVGAGLADHDLQVIKIDYNLPENPVWLRHILDEVVEVSPDHYLGKLHLRLLPNFSVALGYFELEKKSP